MLVKQPSNTVKDDKVLQNKNSKIYPLFFYKDIWDFNISFFEKHKQHCSSPERWKKIDFSFIENLDIKYELKRFAYDSLEKEYLKLSTLVSYFRKKRIEYFLEFLSLNSLQDKTLLEIYNKENLHELYVLYLKSKKIDFIFIHQIPNFLYEIKEKNDDIWDVRDIDYTKIAKHHSNYMQD